MLKRLSKGGRISLVLILLLMLTACPNNSNNSNQVKDVRREIAREIAVQIHRAENTLLRLTEYKRVLAKDGKIDVKANVEISTYLLQVNNIILAANNFLANTKVITPENRQQAFDLISNGLLAIDKLNQSGTFITDSKYAKQFFEFVRIIQSAFQTTRIILEGIR